MSDKIVLTEEHFVSINIYIFALVNLYRILLILNIN